MRCVNYLGIGAAIPVCARSVPIELMLTKSPRCAGNERLHNINAGQNNALRIVLIECGCKQSENEEFYECERARKLRL